MRRGKKLLTTLESAVSPRGSNTICFTGFSVMNILLTTLLLRRQISAGMRRTSLVPS